MLSVESDLLLTATRAALHGEITTPPLEINWRHFGELAQQQGVLGLVAQGLNSFAQAPDDVRDELRTTLRQTAHHTLALTAQLQILSAGWEAAGQRVLAYKGPALAVQAYGDLSLRQCLDLDFIMPKEQMWAARDVLLQAGYEHVDAHTEVEERQWIDGYYHQLYRHRNTGMLIEMHWDVSPPYYPFFFDIDKLCQNAVQVQVGGCQVWAPDVINHFLIICTHGAKHSWRKLEWVASLAAFLLNGIDAMQLLRQAQEVHAHRPVLVGCALAEKWFEIKLPVEIEQVLQADKAAQITCKLLSENSFESLQGFRRIQEPWRRIKLWRLSRENLQYSRGIIHHYLKNLVAVSERDRRQIKLPQALHWLYPILRPVRILSDTLKKQ